MQHYGLIPTLIEQNRLFNVTMSVVMLNVIKLNFILVITLSTIMVCVIMSSAIMTSAIFLSVNVLCVIMLSVLFPCFEFYYADRRNAACCYAVLHLCQVMFSAMLSAVMLSVIILNVTTTQNVAQSYSIESTPLLTLCCCPSGSLSSLIILKKFISNK
jgi:hypothetical protein